MNFTVIEGIISGLDRTNHISGGGETMARTSHISIFNLSGERVILTSNYPAMIADGDHLKLVGVRGQGLFSAIACKNLTTGWMTTFKTESCAKIMLSLVIIGSILVNILVIYFFPAFSITLIVPIIFGVFLFMIIRSEARMKRAYNMLNS